MKPGYLTLAMLVVSWGCSVGKSDAASTAGTGPSESGGGNANGTPSVSTGSGGSTAAGAGLPPETEVESSYEVPVATGRYIWVANPDSGRVAYVDGTTLDVHTVEAGDAPTYIGALPSATDDSVIVVNALSDDATVLRVKAGVLAKTTVGPLAAGANSLAVSASGRWVVAWTNARSVTNPDPLQGYQALTIIDLSAASGTSTILSVGFRPVAVAFASDESKAFAVTQDGVSVVNLTAAAGPGVTGNVALTTDPSEDADTRDVSITPNGRLALVRREGSASIGIIDLQTGTLGAIALSGAVTDLDLTADGSRAVAVVRDTSEVDVIPLGAGIPDPSAITKVTISGETVGSASIAANGTTVLLYTNAVSVDRMTVLTLGSPPSYRVVKLHAPVLAVFPTADAANAVVFHGDSPPPPTAGDAGTRADAATPAVADAGVPSQTPAAAFSLVPLAADLPAEIEETDVPPQAVAMSPAGDRVLVTERDDQKQIYGVYLGAFPSLQIQKLPLASPPIAVGVLAGPNEGYVAQKNPEGRITFISLMTEQARTLTGFEIGASVVDWSQTAGGADGGSP
jgi:hypothetical protein